MAILSEKQFVERLEFFDGQRLFAADLDALDRLHQSGKRSFWFQVSGFWLNSDPVVFLRVVILNEVKDLWVGLRVSSFGLRVEDGSFWFQVSGFHFVARMKRRAIRDP
jgi:hypothetical protein